MRSITKQIEHTDEAFTWVCDDIFYKRFSLNCMEEYQLVTYLQEANIPSCNIKFMYISQMIPRWMYSDMQTSPHITYKVQRLIWNMYRQEQ